MKAIDVKSGDSVFYNGEAVTVVSMQLNTVTIQVNGSKQTVSYSQIKKQDD